MGSKTVPQIPVIDLSGENSKPGSGSWVSACKRVQQALEEHGFFVAEYDKLPLQHHNAIFSEVAELFELPYETKIRNTGEKPTHGYVGKIANLPLYEGMGIDRATESEVCEKFTKLMWPCGNDGFCRIVHGYAKLMAELEKMVVQMIFESYGVSSYYSPHVEATTYLMRFMSYQKPENGEANLAFRSHTDKSFISILHQNHVRGLELQTSNGDWVRFQPSPSSFVVMAGDACMAWSNDRIRPAYHRVVMEGFETRYSLGVFSFQSNKLIETPKELVSEDHPLQYKPFDHLGLLRFYDSADFRKRSEHTMMKAYCGVST